MLTIFTEIPSGAKWYRCINFIGVYSDLTYHVYIFIYHDYDYQRINGAIHCLYFCCILLHGIQYYFLFHLNIEHEKKKNIYIYIHTDLFTLIYKFFLKLIY